jgi:SOS-response transcriptional repressor LexA
MLAVMPYEPPLKRVDVEALLQSRGRSLRWLASRLGVNRQSMVNWLEGINAPREDEVWIRLRGELAALQEQSTGFTLQPGFPPPAPYADGLSHPKVGRRLFPVLGPVGAAEFPAAPGDPDTEHFEEFSDALYTDRVDRFFVEIKGDSMEDTWEHGDLALVHPDPGWRSSGVYVCVQTREGALLKLLMGKGGQWALVPENPDYPIIPIDDPEMTMLGYVVGLKRGYGARDYMEIGKHLGLRPRKRVLAEVTARFEEWLAKLGEIAR